jgi:hypothetical protein
LAKNLYTSKARFVFELLQNADDNSYTKAAALDSVPYVSFRIYPQKIVLECNEDGFTSENLVAISTVGKSSKTGAQGYIGEKGIGFKSVFMAASKVHIQSGPLSFSFRHRNGESGMGMISPIWEETNEVLESPLTRITLHLHDTGDSDSRAKAREVIQEQFEELQETILLFLKNLRRVRVDFCDDEAEEPVSSAIYSIERPQANYAILKRTKVAGETTEERVKHFHVTTHEATNLARNENREYSEAEEASRAYSKSRVVLAFPLSETSVPIIQQQNLFVFLPVRPVGFKFLIQADFVTDASRQDIVADSLRNISLLNGIADAFVKAVLQFCEHDTLRYQWMRYLPDIKSDDWSTLWKLLVNRISDCLKQTPVIYGRKRFDRQLISGLVRLTYDVLDEDSEPLFDDGDADQIVSPRYDASDLDILVCYGLKLATFGEIIRWLKEDLERGTFSRMKSPQTPESWHTRVAILLHRPFEEGWTYDTRQLKDMDLLPLEDDSWVSGLSSPVYFAQVNSIDIPLDIGLRLIQKSVRNAHRMTLFKDLGVQTASADLVRKKILERYFLERRPASYFRNSKHHLEFLYLTEHLKGDNELPYANLSICDTKCKLHRPRIEHMYIANNEPYGAWGLFRTTEPGPNPGDGAPGYDLALFVNEGYFKNAPATPQQQTLAWSEWFYDRLGVKKYVCFEHGEVENYLREHRPEKFLGGLHRWFQHSGVISPTHVDRLQKTEILCRSNRRVLLKNTYFPTKVLERRVGRFVEQNAFFPWLWLDVETTYDAIPSDWGSLLKTLDAGFPSTDLDFALDMLKCSISALTSPITSTSRARLFELYHHLQNVSREEDDRSKAREKIRYVPFGYQSKHSDTGTQGLLLRPNIHLRSAYRREWMLLGLPRPVRLECAPRDEDKVCIATAI